MIKDNVIANYQIVAPTEWNFQRGGVAELSLQTLDARDTTTLLRHAALIINTIALCVNFELAID